MKRLFILLSLFGVVGLHGDDVNAAVTLATSDGQVVLVPDVKIFSTLKNLVGDIGADEGPIPVPYDSNYLKHVLNLYGEEPYHLPVTTEELTEADITLQELLRTLNYFDAERFLEKFYIAWLNHPQNADAAVFNNIPASVIFHQMGLDTSELHRDITNIDISLIAEDIDEIRNYTTRQQYVSIPYLRASGNMPAINDGILDLSNKNLRGTLNTSDFVGIPGIETVTFLNLSNNQLTRIEPGTFAGLTALKILYLDNNKLNRIEPGTFAGLTALRGLYLDNNQLTRIEPGTFVGLTALKILYLYNNQLTRIESGTFAGLTALKILYLYNNQLTRIEPRTFAGLTALIARQFCNIRLLPGQGWAIE